MFSAIALTIASLYIEIVLIKAFPWLLEHMKRSPVIALIASVMLSAVIGHLFGASGVTCLIAGLCSTLLSNMYYKTSKQINEVVKVVVELPAVKATVNAFVIAGKAISQFTTAAVNSFCLLFKRKEAVQA